MAIIEGLRMEISSAALKDLLVRRVDYHAGKAEWAKGKAQEIKPDIDVMADEAEEQGKYGSSGYKSSNNPLQLFWEQHHVHRDKATVFKFMSEHLIQDATYRLEENDLRKLEVLSTRW